MKKITILSAMSMPLLIAGYGLLLLTGPRAGGFGDLAGAIVMMVAIIAVLLVSITLFFLRKRELQWWQGLLISAGGVALTFAVIVLAARVSN